MCYRYLNRIVPKSVHILADSSTNRATHLEGPRNIIGSRSLTTTYRGCPSRVFFHQALFPPSSIQMFDPPYLYLAYLLLEYEVIWGHIDILVVAI